MHMCHAGSHIACPQQLQVLWHVRLYEVGLEVPVLSVFHHHEDRPSHRNDSHKLSHERRLELMSMREKNVRERDNRR